MKTLSLLFLAAGLLAAGCGQSHQIQSPNELQSAGLAILSATYGIGTNFVDVTDRVVDSLGRPHGVAAANPDSLGADPLPGWNKALVIVYEHQRRRCLFTTGEGGKVTVPALLEAAGN
jgi:hypothetical protein